MADRPSLAEMIARCRMGSANGVGVILPPDDATPDELSALVEFLRR